MLHFKNRSGFGLPEAMIAITVIAFVLTPIFALQVRLYRLAAESSARLDRLLLAKKFLYEARMEQEGDEKEFTLEESHFLPRTELRYELRPAQKNPAFKNIPGLFTEQVIIEWEEGGVPKTDRLATLLYRFIPEDKDKK